MPRYNLTVTLPNPVDYPAPVSALRELVTRDLRAHGVPEDEINTFEQALQAAPYHHVRKTIQKWVNIDPVHNKPTKL